MPIESSFANISNLNPSYPQAGDDPSEGDDHIRGTKEAIVGTWPNVNATVNATDEQTNFLVGVTSAIQTQINNRSLVLVSSASASSSATIDFTSGIDSTANEYWLEIINAVPSVSSAPVILTSANAGGAWDAGSTDYDYTYARFQGTSATVANGGTGGASLPLLGTNVTTTTAWGGFSAWIRILNPSGTTHHKRIDWEGSAATSTSNGNLARVSGTGSRAATTAVNGISFRYGSGNVVSGLFRLYKVTA